MEKLIKIKMNRGCKDSNMSGKIVKLNIGGTLYQTTADTLTRSHNFFSGLLDKAISSTKDADGAYFIDRNGRLFEPLLDYLRTGKLFILPGMSRAAVLEEATFYSIELPESEMWTENQWEYCILEISANVLSGSPGLLGIKTFAP